VDLEVPVDDLLVQEKISNKFAQKIDLHCNEKKVLHNKSFLFDTNICTNW